MKKHANLSAACCYGLAALCYGATLFVSEHKTLLMAVGSVMMVFGILFLTKQTEEK